MSLIRWFLFLFIGLPIHWALMPLYIIAFLLWRIIGIFKTINQKVIYDHQSANVPVYDKNKKILINKDNHGMLTQWTVAEKESFQWFVYDKGHGLTFMRVPNPNSPDAFNEVSGDCVVFFCFAMVNASNDVIVYNKNLILKLAKTYLLNLGCLSYDAKNNGNVSARCNNFGINWCPDGWAQLGQPAFGPQYFTSSALFALASKFSFMWKIIYHAHRIIMGGWIFELMPLIVPKEKMFYIRDVVAKAIYVHEYVLGVKPWMIRAYNLISRSTEYKNPFLCALAKRLDYNYESIPDYVHRFFGQNKTGLSEYDSSGVPNVKQNLIKFITRQ